MSKKINKHGLSRYIGSDIARKIRRDSGFGCVICGGIFFHYEHIDPEFNNALEHDPDKMTLLCAKHHDDVTHGRLHKDDVWDAKSNPYNIQRGIRFSELHHQKKESNIYLGSNLVGSSVAGVFNKGGVAIRIFGKPILWFEISDSAKEPINTCAIFYNNGSSPHAYLNRNCFIKEIDDYDMNTLSTRIEIRKSQGDIDLILDFPGRGDIAIERLRMTYLNAEVIIKKNGDTIFKQGENSIVSSTSTFGSIALGEALEKNSIDIYPYHKLAKFIEISFFGNEILSYNGEVLGWLNRDGVIYNNKYNFVGVASSFKLSEFQVLTINGEGFAILHDLGNKNGRKRFLIGYDDDSYLSCEPIWISPGDRASKLIRNESINDLGYRLFNIGGCY